MACHVSVTSVTADLKIGNMTGDIGDVRSLTGDIRRVRTDVIRHVGMPRELFEGDASAGASEMRFSGLSVAPNLKSNAPNLRG